MTEEQADFILNSCWDTGHNCGPTSKQLEEACEMRLYTERGFELKKLAEDKAKKNFKPIKGKQ